MHRYSESMDNASDDLRQKTRNAAKLGGVLFCLCAAASAVLAAESKDALSVLLARFMRRLGSPGVRHIVPRRNTGARKTIAARCVGGGVLR